MGFNPVLRAQYLRGECDSERKDLIVEINNRLAINHRQAFQCQCDNEANAFNTAELLELNADFLTMKPLQRGKCPTCEYKDIGNWYFEKNNNICPGCGKDFSDLIDKY